MFTQTHNTISQTTDQNTSRPRLIWGGSPMSCSRLIWGGSPASSRARLVWGG